MMREWYCPACGRTLAVNKPASVTPFHPCPKMGLLSTPFVPAGTRAKLEIVERGDWVGGETVTVAADGRVPMSIVTTRDDGMDCTVFAALAEGSAHG